MLDFLHTHHTGEDELLFPLLRKRTALDPELMDRMDEQHAAPARLAYKLIGHRKFARETTAIRG
jgi:hypothetical protein